MITVETSGAGRGADQMDRDVRSARECLAGRRTPHVRLYWWRPPAISLGAHQSQELVHASLAAIHGVDVVVRPTGGGAILHADELTYAVTLPLGNHTPAEAYAAVTSALVSGLAGLNIHADAERWPTAFKPDGEYRAASLCFGDIARDEIRVGRKKLVGSAQRIYRSQDGDRAVLQHGSILLTDAHARLPLYMRSRTPSVSRALIQRLSDRSTSVRELLGRDAGVEEVAAAVADGFRSSRDLTRWDSAVRTDQRQEVAA